MTSTVQIFNISGVLPITGTVGTTEIAVPLADNLALMGEHMSAVADPLRSTEMLMRFAPSAPAWAREEDARAFLSSNGATPSGAAKYLANPTDPKGAGTSDTDLADEFFSAMGGHLTADESIAMMRSHMGLFPSDKKRAGYLYALSSQYQISVPLDSATAAHHISTLHFISESSVSILGEDYLTNAPFDIANHFTLIRKCAERFEQRLIDAESLTDATRKEVADIHFAFVTRGALYYDITKEKKLVRVLTAAPAAISRLRHLGLDSKADELGRFVTNASEKFGIANSSEEEVFARYMDDLANFGVDEFPNMESFRGNYYLAARVYSAYARKAAEEESGTLEDLQQLAVSARRYGFATMVICESDMQELFNEDVAHLSSLEEVIARNDLDINIIGGPSAQLRYIQHANLPGNMPQMAAFKILYWRSQRAAQIIEAHSHAGESAPLRCDLWNLFKPLRAMKAERAVLESEDADKEALEMLTDMMANLGVYGATHYDLQDGDGPISMLRIVPDVIERYRALGADAKAERLQRFVEENAVKNGITNPIMWIRDVHARYIEKALGNLAKSIGLPVAVVGILDSHDNSLAVIAGLGNYRFGLWYIKKLFDALDAFSQRKDLAGAFAQRIDPDYEVIVHDRLLETISMLKEISSEIERDGRAIGIIKEQNG